VARNSAVGLDIGTRSINVAEVTAKGGSTSVTDFGRLELPVGAVREGEILDTTAVAGAVRQLMGHTSIKDKKVHLGIANQRVVVRQIDLPWMPEDEFRTSLRFQVQEFIPIPVEDAELDFHVLEEFSEGDKRMQRMMLVAAHKDMVAAHIQAAQEAGLRPVGVDLNPFAVLRALGEDSALSSGSEVLIDVGAGVTNIVVHDDGVPRFVRILVLGGDDITEALMSAGGTTFEDADELKKRLGLRQTGEHGEAERTIEQRAGAFVDEVRSSLDYYQAQTGAGRISRVVLSGGGALLAGLPERLAGVLRVPVERAKPFDRLPATKTEFGPEELEQVGPLLTTAIGLGLGGLA
jgi:type IV pilus assembly protein PilM